MATNSVYHCSTPVHTSKYHQTYTTMMRQLRLLTGLLALAFGQLTAQIPCNGEFINSGSATNQGGCIQLTPNATGQQGCTWLNTPVDFSQPLSHTMILSFGTNDAGGADGICLVYQPNGTGVCGGQGGGIGALGIPNSFIVEFDTWDNGAAVGDIPADHCAVNLNGVMTAPIEGPVALPNIENGADHTVTFEWDPGTMMYMVYFDGVLRLSGTLDIVNTVFGGNSQVYWGYTSSTGAATNIHEACPILPEPIIVDAGPNIVLPCVGASLVLDGTGSDQAPGYSYEWSTQDGSIVSGFFGLTPTIDAAGTYVLTLTDLTTGCVETDEVIVTVSSITAIIAPPAFLTCTGTLTLDGSGSSSGPFITYEWSTSDGNIVSQNGPTAEVNQEGNYTLTVLYDDGVSMCTETFTTNVQADPDVPIAFAPDTELTCDPPNVEIDGSASSSGPNYAYEWTTSGGQITSGEFSAFPTVSLAGQYTLLVTNTETGCTAEHTVTVIDNTSLPSAIILAPNDINCTQNQLVLNGSGSIAAGGAGLSFEWVTSNGTIISGQGTNMLTVGAPGSYTLFVTDNENNCQSDATVIVVGDVTAPTVDIAPPLPLTCTRNSLTLNAGASEQGPGFTYQWTTATGVITSGDNTLSPQVSAPGTYQLSIFNPANGCTGMASVLVTQDTIRPVANAGVPQVFVCGETSLILNGSGSSQGPGFSYLWTTPDGEITSGAATLTPTVSMAGVYQLQVTNNNTGCTQTASVNIANDNNAATVIIAVNDTLDCATTLLTLDATTSSQGPNYSFVWSTTDGHFVSGQGTLTPVVDQSGVYVLSITNLTNNCVAVASIPVVQNTVPPTAIIAPADTLFCNQTTVTLNGTASSQGSHFVYQWTTSGSGNLVSGQQGLTPQVDQPGTYTLTIRNNLNQCLADTSIQVQQDTLSPTIAIATPDVLDCTTLQVTLDASTSDQGPNYTFNWTPVPPGVASLTPTVSLAGVYNLTIQNLISGCVSNARVEVLQDTLAPIADAGPDLTISCRTPQLELQGQASSSGAGIQYQWTTPDGLITAGANSPEPTVGQGGTYSLLVSNTNNGCEATDATVVGEDFEAPISIIGLPALLTCIDTLVSLNGSASSVGPDMRYTWSTPNGSILSGASTPTVEVSQAGLYVLEVENNRNGCTARDTAEVLRDENFPLADIAEPLDLTCTRTTLNLAGLAVAQSGNLSFSWSTIGGSITAGNNSLTPTIDAPGIYNLQVTDLANNCRALASITVVLDTIRPVVSIEVPQPINCDVPQRRLDASASVQPGFSFEWTTADGQLIADFNTPQPLAGAAGLYSLQVTNPINGCIGQADINLGADLELPISIIQPPLDLTCSRTSIMLDAGASQATSPLSFQWSTTDGNIQSGAQTASPTVNEPGLYQLIIRNTLNGCRDTSLLAIEQDTVKPLALIQMADTLNCIRTSLSLQTNGSSTGPNFELSWTTVLGNILSGADGPNPLIDQPGQYFLKVTNLDNGCVATAAVSVVRNITQPVIALASPQQLNCLRSTLQLNANGTEAGPQPLFSWTGPVGGITAGANTLTPTVVAPGVYTLTATNQVNGCTATDGLTVFQNVAEPTTIIARPDTLDCQNSQLSLSAVGSSSGAIFDYQWSTTNGNILSGATTLNPVINEAGTYVLLIENTANGCTSADTIAVIQDTLSPIAVIAEADRLDCANLQSLLDGTGSSVGSHIQYAWTPQAGGQLTGPTNGISAQAIAAGDYILRVTNINNGCQSSAMVQVDRDVTLPFVAISPPAVLNCITTQTALNATASDQGSPFVATWTTAGGSFLSGQTTLQPTVNAAGVYTLSIRNTDNSCENSASVTVLRDVTPPVARAGQDFVIPCFEPTANLNGTGSSVGAGYAYLWSTVGGSLEGGQTTLSPSISGPGLYSLLVTNLNNGCTARDEVAVSQRIPTASALINNPRCYGEEGSIVISQVANGVSPYIFSVNGGEFFQTSAVFNSLTAGVYDLVVQDANGCEFQQRLIMTQPDSLVVVITEPEVRIELGQSHQVIALVNVHEDSLASIQWEQNGSLSCGDCLNPLATPLESGLYRITVRDRNGCKDESLLRIIVDRSRHVYIPNAFSPNGDGFNDLLLIYTRLESVKRVKRFEVYNRWGESVFTAYDFAPNNPIFGWDGLFRGQSLQPAVFAYYAEIEFIDGVVEIFKGDVTLVK